MVNIEGKKKTVGQLSSELLSKNTIETHSYEEQMRENLTDYEKNIEQCIKDNINKYDDFYIVVLTKKERVMKNVIRNYFLARSTCPTPNYDQIVYKYRKEDDTISLIWVIPDRKISKYMRANSTEVDPSQYELLSNILKFADGSLYRLSKELNNEQEKTPELRKN